jgi:release factor glutamine methyltransferase
VAAAYRAAVERRRRREPLQHILGWEEFRGLRLRVTPDVLVPRPETEVLVEVALALPLAGGPCRVVDVGTGSGCVACAIARERPGARVLALDRCPRALAVARANVEALRLADRVRLLCADLLDPVVSRGVDLVVANPPYLPAGALPSLPPEVRDWEPRLALDGGPDGLAVIRRLVAGAGRVLRPGGALALETAGGEQAHAVARLVAQTGFDDVAVAADLAGVDRIVTARRRPP